jgi:hypothetical protein
VIGSTETPVATATETAVEDPAAECLEIVEFDSSTLDRNDTFVELGWKVEISNTCAQPFSVYAQFAIYDADDFELDNGSEAVMVPANGSAIARGTMLVSPTSKVN